MGTVYNVHKGFGDYIHYSYSNYVKYGLAPKISGASSKNSGPQTLEQAYRLEKTRVMKSIKTQSYSQEIRGLEQFLTSLRLTGGVGRNETEIRNFQALQDMVFSHLSTKVKGLQPTDIDYTTLTLKESAKSRLSAKLSNEDLQKALKKMQTEGQVDAKELQLAVKISTLLNNELASGGQSANSYIGSWRRHLQTLHSAIVALESQGQDIATIQSLTAQLDLIRSAIDSWGASGRVANAIIEATEIKAIKNTTIGKKNYKSGDKIPLKLAMRALAKSILGTLTMSQLNGELGEAVVGAAAKVMNGTLQKGVDDILDNVLGSLPGSPVVQKSSFSKYVDAKTLYTTGFEEIKGNSGDVIGWKVKNDITKGKIDVEATINGKIFDANVKNYNLNNPKVPSVNLVSGTNMIYLLQNHTTFTNHYLNQTTYGNSFKDNPGITEVIAANTIMKRLLFLLALAGGGYRTDITSGKKASVFILNDNKRKGQIRVLPIAQVYHNIIDFNYPVNVTLNDDQTWPNYYATSAQERITKLIMAVRQHKISVSIPHTTIRNALGFI